MEDTLAEAPDLSGVPAPIRKRLLESVAPDFQKLWAPIEAEARRREAQVRAQLDSRGEKEAQALRRILEEQRDTIQEELGLQLEFNLAIQAEREQQEQWKRDRNHLRQRLVDIGTELRTQPDELRLYYGVRLTRLVPVGLVYLWPTALDDGPAGRPLTGCAPCPRRSTRCDLRRSPAPGNPRRGPRRHRT